jgi:uncharacterized protein YukE
MDYIHAETDELRDTGRECERAYLALADSLRGLRAAAYRLEADWQGGAAESFQYELGEWLRGMAEAVEEADFFGRVLASQAEDWEEIDQRWTGAYREPAPARARPGADGTVPAEAVRA